MKIAFLMNQFDTTNIPKNPRHIGYYITKHLEKCGAEVEIIPPAITAFDEFPYKIKQAFYQYICGKRHLRYSEIGLIKKEAKRKSELLKNISADFVFSFGPIAASFLKTDKKIAYWTDSTVAGLLGYHPDFLNLTKSTIRNTDYLERRCISRCSAVFFASSWAERIANVAYSDTIKKNKNLVDNLVIAPFGANTDIENSEEQIKNFIAKRTQQQEIRLLLVSYSWTTKGGDIAAEIIHRINQKGYKAKLIVIGCDPKLQLKLQPTLAKYIEIVGKIDKNKNPDKFYEFLENASFYISPARAENFGHALVEANSFGLPAISTKTGGVPDVIRNGINGQLFDSNTSIDEFADYIINTFKDKKKYRQLCLSSFSEYKTRLNWDAGAKIVYDTMKNILDKSKK